MQATVGVWQGVRTLWAALCLVLSLAVAPTIDAVNHGPGAMAAEADHRAWHDENGQSHAFAGTDHHDPSDHDHVGAELLVSSTAEIHPPPARTLRPGAFVASGTIRDGPRRPTRLTPV